MAVTMSIGQYRNRTSTRVLSIFFLVFQFSFQLLAQTDSVQHQGSWKISLHEKWIVADQHYNDAGEKQDNVAEYGIFATALEVNRFRSNGFTTSVWIPVITRVYSVLPMSGTKQSAWRTGTFRASVLQPLLLDSMFRINASFDIGIPLVDALKFEIQPTAPFSFNQRLKITLQKRIPEIRSSIWLYGGFRNYSKGISDEWHYGLAGSIGIADTRIGLCLCGVSSLRNGDDFTGNYPETLYSNNASSLSLSPSIELQLEKMISVSMGVDAVLHAKNRLAGTAYKLSVMARFE